MACYAALLNSSRFMEDIGLIPFLAIVLGTRTTVPEALEDKKEEEEEEGK